MRALLEMPHWTVSVAGRQAHLNSTTVVMSWIVMAALLAFAALATRRLRLVPGPVQSTAEVVVQSFRQIVDDSLGKLGPRYLAFILSLFLFIGLSNALGVIPFLEEPTRDLNTTLILALLSVGASHACAIRVRGWRPYLRDYFQPFLLMFPLNVIGELSKVVSLSFRLYGNIMGGSIIIYVVSGLVRHILLPPLLNAFFGLFVGIVQAFLFALLTLTYISVAIQE